MSITNNPNTDQHKHTQKSPGRKLGQTVEAFIWFDEYRDFLQGRMVPVSEAFIERIARDYVTWATTDESALIITQFPLSKSIPPETFYDWIRRSPILAQAHTIVLTCIGNRRELGGLNKRLSENMVSFTMPSYNKDWKDLQEWRASIKDAKTNVNEQKVIIMEKIVMPVETPEPLGLPDKEHKSPEEVARRASMHDNKKI